MLYGHDEGKNIKQLCDGTKDVVCIKMGGTGASSLAEAQEKLGIKENSDRIDNLVLNSGSGYPEIVDARLSSDGTQYTTLKSRLDAENSELKSDLNDISDTTKNLWSKGDITFERSKIVDFSLTAGTYTLSAVCTTNDTDSTYGVIYIRNGTNNLASFIFGRNSRQSAKFSISSEADNVLFLASDTDLHSVGDTATYKDIQIEVGEKQTEYVSHFIAKDTKARDSIAYVSDYVQKVDKKVDDTIDDIQSGVVIKKGIVTNVLDGDFSIGTKQWIYRNGSATVSDKTLAIVGNGNGNYIRGSYYSEINISDNPYFACAKVRVKDENCDSIIINIAGGYEHTKITKPIKDKWYTLACLYSGKQTGSITSFFSISANYADNTSQSGKILEIKECIGIYLKDDFGLGDIPKMFEMMNIVYYNGYWNGTKTLIIKKEELKSSIKRQQTCFSANRKPLLTIVDDDGWQRMYDEFLPISERYNVPFVSSIQINSTVNNWNALFAQNEMNWELAVHPDCLQAGGLATLETESEIEQWMIDTNKYLDEHGYKWTNCVYANGEPDERVRRIAKKYYKCGAVGSNPMVNKGVVPMFEIQRIPVGYPMGAEWNTFEHLKTYIDEAISDNGWCVLMTHAGMTDWHTSETTEIIRQLIEYALDNGVEVTTLEKGLETFGNALEVGDYIGTAEQGFAISYDGQFSRNPFATT